MVHVARSPNKQQQLPQQPFSPNCLFIPTLTARRSAPSAPHYHSTLCTVLFIYPYSTHSPRQRPITPFHVSTCPVHHRIGSVHTPCRLVFDPAVRNLCVTCAKLVCIGEPVRSPSSQPVRSSAESIQIFCNSFVSVVSVVPAPSNDAHVVNTRVHYCTHTSTCPSSELNSSSLYKREHVNT